MIPLHLIIHNENCCVACLSVFCLIYSEGFVLTPGLTIRRGKSLLFINGAILLVNTGGCGRFGGAVGGAGDPSPQLPA